MTSWLPSQQPNLRTSHGHSSPASTPQLVALEETGLEPTIRIATSVGMPTASFMPAWKALNGGGFAVHIGGLPPTQHPASEAARNKAIRARIEISVFGQADRDLMTHGRPGPPSRRRNQWSKSVSHRLSRRLPPSPTLR